MNQFRRQVRLANRSNRKSSLPAPRQVSPHSNQSIARAFRVMAPTLFTLTFASVAHAQGTMDFSGAQTLMGTFKTFATLSAAQLRVLLRAIVNLDPYTFADDLAEDIAGDNENEQRSAEEVLLSTIDATADDKLTRFALRLALAGHLGIPREGEFDFLTEAEGVFAPPEQKKKAALKKAKQPTPIESPAKPTRKAKVQKATSGKKKIAA